jgi:Mycoplasma protein of unknown function, DUF285
MKSNNSKYEHNNHNKKMILWRQLQRTILRKRKGHAQGPYLVVTLPCLALLLFLVGGPGVATRMLSTMTQFPLYSRANRRLQRIIHTNDSIRDAVELWLKNREGAEATYGLISEWDTSHVTDMSRLFEGSLDFDSLDILAWDTSMVKDFGYMFAGCRSFDQDLASWDFSSAENLSGMFNGAVSFNQGLGWTNTLKVTDMSAMFKGAVKFDGSMAGLDTSSVEDMNMMFYDAASFSGQGMDFWNVSKVGRFDRMFMNAYAFNGAIQLWTPARVTTMHSMFENALLFSQDIRAWVVSSELENISRMFTGALSFTHTLCWPNVSTGILAAKTFCNSPGSLDEDCFDTNVVTWAGSCDASEGDFVAFYGDSYMDSAPNMAHPGFAQQAHGTSNTTTASPLPSLVVETTVPPVIMQGHESALAISRGQKTESAAVKAGPGLLTFGMCIYMNTMVAVFLLWGY